METNKLQIIGAVTGLAGTGLMAFALAPLFWTFVLYGISNAAWIAFGLRLRAKWLCVMNAGYVVMTVSGLVNYWPS